MLVTEWVDGTPLSRIIADGHAASSATARACCSPAFLFSGPARAGLLHADPHPGNFRLLDDGRLGVLDFGAVEPAARRPAARRSARCSGWPSTATPTGCSPGCARRASSGPASTSTPSGCSTTSRRSWSRRGPTTFRFTRAWLRAQAVRVGDPRSPAYSTGLQLNLPPAYLLIHRVTLGSIGVLCQLEAEAAWRAELEQWLPGFKPERRPTRAGDSR